MYVDLMEFKILKEKLENSLGVNVEAPPSINILIP